MTFWLKCDLRELTRHILYKSVAIPYPRAFVCHKSTQEILIGVGVAVIIPFVNIVTPSVEGRDLIHHLSSISSPHTEEDCRLSKLSLCVQLHMLSELCMIFCLGFHFWWDIGLSILLTVSEICLISINFVLDWMTPVVCQALLFLLSESPGSLLLK